MVKEIVWSVRADKNFDRVIEYLQQNWTEKEVQQFVTKTYDVLDLISKGNVIFRSSGKKNIHEVLITKHNLLIYRIRREYIELITFYDTRQHPQKKKF